jgi:hypothetical protein
MGFYEFKWDAHIMAKGGPPFSEAVERVALWGEVKEANELSELFG